MDVKEGFLCPICMTDLGDVIQLQVHFDEKHSKEDAFFVQNLKDLFGKAKKKILKDSSSSGDLGGLDLEQEMAAEIEKFYGIEPSEYHPVSGIHRNLEEVNKLVSRDHFQTFRAERAKRADIRAMDMNKLIVRLEKLMNQLPADPVKRRAHEQAVVPWLNEEDVKLCPNCAKSFGLTRRKHHCRLCGGIMCSDCSELVSFEMANRLVNPATISKFRTDQDDNSKTSPSKKRTTSYEGLVSNLADLAGLAEGQRNFRSCPLCKEVLERRDGLVQLASAPQPDLVRYYEHLRNLMTQGSQMSDTYRKMAASLNLGETNYRLEEAKLLRMQVLKSAETVEALSKKIAILEADDSMTLTLQKRIRSSAVNFVKETLVGLPSVPSEQELEQIKLQRVQEAAQRIAQEKRNAMEAKQRFQEAEQRRNDPASRRVSSNSPMATAALNATQNMLSSAMRRPQQKAQKGLRFGQGFVATTAASASKKEDDDPLKQQIENLKTFIQQATEAGKMDDAHILQNNLRDLQEEYKKQRDEEKQELEQNYMAYKHLFAKVPSSSSSSEEEDDELNPFAADNDEEDNGKNPFEQDQDEYDKSGKNPFSA